MIRMQAGLMVGLLAFSFVPAPVFAAETANPNTPESILLSPTSKRYELDAGSSKTDTVKVINDGQTDFNFVTYARPYSVNDESYTPDFTSDAQNADAYKWVQFDQPSYQIKAGESVDIPYTIRVPQNATPGGHYGVLFAETQPDAGRASGNAILRKKRVGAILYVNVNGEVTTGGSFKGTDIPLFQFKAPLKIRQRVENSGNTDFSVSTSIRVKDLFGGLKYELDKESAVLPSSSRSIISDWETPAWLGIYKIEQTAKFLDTTKTSTQLVLFIPIWVYLTLVLLVGGRVLYAVVRHRKK